MSQQTLPSSGTHGVGLITAKMANMTLAPAPVPVLTDACFERHEQLLHDFAQVVSEYQRMHAAQLQAVLKGQDFPFEEWIAEAAARRVQLKQALLQHRQQHNC